MTASADLQARKAAAVSRGVANRNIDAHRAKNAELWDADAKRDIDFAVGLAVNNTGQCHPKVMATVARQTLAFTHLCFHVAPCESHTALAERLNALTPGDFPKKTMLVASGAEAVETAAKMARAFTGRSGVISFTGAFHGRTLPGMALTGKVIPFQKTFGAMPAEVVHAPFPNAFHGISEAEAIRTLDGMLAATVDPERIAALIIKPVQGEGGFNIAPPGFLRHLRAVCDRHGIVLIADAVPAGMARTGRMFGFEHSGVVPDLVTMAMGRAGVPLSAVTGRAEIVDAPHAGGLGGTYGGKPIAAAASHAVLDVIVEEGLCERARRIGEIIRAHLTALAARQGMGCIGDGCGLGAMHAFELMRDRDSGKPDAALTAAVVAEAEARGLTLLSRGTRHDVIRLLPPLTIPWDQLDEALDIIEAALDAAVQRQAAA